MELSTDIVKRYEGGQLEIQNSGEGYLYRGEVERAWVESGSLCVRFKWLAIMGEDGQWHASNDLDYSVSLQIISVSEIGENRIFYSVMFVGEHGTFFPPGGSRLDRDRVIMS